MRTSLAVFVMMLLASACAGPKMDPRPPTAKPGTISGKVTRIGTCTPQTRDCKDIAADYEVVVLAKDGATVVAKTKTDANGVYTLDVPSGEYTILTPGGLKPSDRRRNDVTVAAGTLATLDLVIDTGVR